MVERYLHEFETKWLRGGAPAGEAFVGSADLQSLADLGNSYEVVRTMKPAPATKEMIPLLPAATLAPILALAPTMMPMEELLKKLLGSLLWPCVARRGCTVNREPQLPLRPPPVTRR